MEKLSFGLIFVLFAAACDGSPDDSGGRRNVPMPGGPGTDPNGTTPGAPLCSNVGTQWKGFAGTNLVQARVDGAIGADRARLKPFNTLADEYQRAIGNVPASLANAAASFGDAPERFYAEPRASAISVWSSFRVGFDGCLTFTEAAPEYADAPTDASATATCTTLARKFWSRAATAEEIDACKQVALTDSATEATPRRRWAFTCASLLSSAGFLTY
jgi:hypothetical protein